MVASYRIRVPSDEEDESSTYTFDESAIKAEENDVLSLDSEAIALSVSRTLVVYSAEIDATD